MSAERISGKAACILPRERIQDTQLLIGWVVMRKGTFTWSKIKNLALALWSSVFKLHSINTSLAFYLSTEAVILLHLFWLQAPKSSLASHCGSCFTCKLRCDDSHKLLAQWSTFKWADSCFKTFLMDRHRLPALTTSCHTCTVWNTHACPWPTPPSWRK